VCMESELNAMTTPHHLDMHPLSPDYPRPSPSDPSHFSLLEHIGSGSARVSAIQALVTRAVDADTRLQRAVAEHEVAVASVSKELELTKELLRKERHAVAVARAEVAELKERHAATTQTEAQVALQSRVAQLAQENASLVVALEEVQEKRNALTSDLSKAAGVANEAETMAKTSMGVVKTMKSGLSRAQNLDLESNPKVDSEVERVRQQVESLRKALGTTNQTLEGSAQVAFPVNATQFDGNGRPPQVGDEETN